MILKVLISLLIQGIIIVSYVEDVLKNPMQAGILIHVVPPPEIVPMLRIVMLLKTEAMLKAHMWKIQSASVLS